MAGPQPLHRAHFALAEGLHLISDLVAGNHIPSPPRRHPDPLPALGPHRPVASPQLAQVRGLLAPLHGHTFLAQDGLPAKLRVIALGKTVEVQVYDPDAMPPCQLSWVILSEAGAGSGFLRTVHLLPPWGTRYLTASQCLAIVDRLLAQHQLPVPPRPTELLPPQPSPIERPARPPSAQVGTPTTIREALPGLALLVLPLLIAAVCSLGYLTDWTFSNIWATVAHKNRVR